MIFKKLVFAILVFTSVTCRADWDSWSDINKKLFIASETAILADWATTRSAAQNWDACGCRELNPLLGPNPSVNRVDIVELGMAVATYFIADHLPEEHRNWYLGLITVLHGAAAANNYALGVRFNLGF